MSMTVDRTGSGEESRPKRVGRHRRATRRPRVTTEGAGIVLRGADLLMRAGLWLKEYEPAREWFHHLTGFATKVVDALGSLL